MPKHTGEGDLARRTEHQRGDGNTGPEITSKVAFLAAMSHEIRTPLNGILGALSLLELTGPVGVQRQYINVAKASSDLLLRLIDNVLELSRLDARAGDATRTIVNLHDLLCGVLRMHDGEAQAKGIPLCLDYPPSVPRSLITDPMRVHQVIENIVSNAVRYTERGCVVVRVRMKNRGERHWLLLDIEDSGTGIDPSEVGLVFDEFVRGTRHAQLAYGGAGLGLSVARRAVAILGGGIDVTTAVGKGSVFRISLPVDTSPEPVHASDAWCPSIGGAVCVSLENAPLERALIGGLRFAGVRAVRLGSGQTARALKHALSRLPAGERITVICDSTSFSEFQGKLSPSDLPAISYFVLLAGEELTSVNYDRRSTEVEWKVISSPVDIPDLITRMQPPSNTTERAESRYPHPVFNGCRVLLAEDNPVNRIVAVDMLQTLGACVEVAEEGREAVSLFSSNPEMFDLVLMDCSMPVMDGFEALAEIRRRGTTRTPIVALTAYALKEDRARCLSAGFDDYVAKPITFAELARISLLVRARIGSAQYH